MHGQRQKKTVYCSRLRTFLLLTCPGSQGSWKIQFLVSGPPGCIVGYSNQCLVNSSIRFSRAAEQLEPRCLRHLWLRHLPADSNINSEKEENTMSRLVQMADQELNMFFIYQASWALDSIQSKMTSRHKVTTFWASKPQQSITTSMIHFLPHQWHIHIYADITEIKLLSKLLHSGSYSSIRYTSLQSLSHTSLHKTTAQESTDKNLGAWHPLGQRCS